MKIPMFPDKLFFIGALLLLLVLFFHKYNAFFKEPPSSKLEIDNKGPLLWGFKSKEEKLDEIWLPEKSTNSDWWLNSGAYFYIRNYKGYTIGGELDENDSRRITYFKNNPSETDDGYHPQNIFRLISRKSFVDVEQELYFKILNYHLSSSENRNESNGVLLFSDYEDSDNLYYAGVRVDGTAVIKRKCEGSYETLLQSNILKGEYNRDVAPNLLKLNHEYGIKSILTHDADATSIHLYFKPADDLDWQLVGMIEDTSDCKPKTNSSIGIRTDFMDVEFNRYVVNPL